MSDIFRVSYRFNGTLDVEKKMSASRKKKDIVLLEKDIGMEGEGVRVRKKVSASSTMISNNASSVG